MIEKIKAKIKEWQAHGVPVLLFRDPVTNEESITFSFFLVSGVLCIAASFHPVCKCLNIDFAQIKEFFDMSMWAYLGRSGIKAMIGSPVVNNKNDQEEKK